MDEKTFTMAYERIKKEVLGYLKKGKMTTNKWLVEIGSRLVGTKKKIWKRLEEAYIQGAVTSS